MKPASATTESGRLVSDYVTHNPNSSFHWTVWEWAVSVKRVLQEQALYYDLHLENELEEFGPAAISAPGTLPRIAFSSCKDCSSPDKMRGFKGRQRLRSVLRTRHEAGVAESGPDDPTGLHLLLGEGDQI